VTVRWVKSYGYDKPALNAHVNQYDKYEAFLSNGKDEVSVRLPFYGRFCQNFTQYLPKFHGLLVSGITSRQGHRSYQDI